ncbi:K(+)-transporting ATPase subunit F [Pectobacteriaceae bacterium CE70]|uniref:K(+)-transporting ATPase subunit F n=1 Tax=Serratia sp. (strain ATCC 39006) TaxID=104623 RepID=A0A2I5TAH8_SERS3|nr:K(+)-transporting ATPase subunit F [Serratia sp. ATCC 39006]AUH05884.1 K(+)-transporting ATPase subunit F [Serratia sp. ATCC 39006]WJV63806.1 K(+)-transporting ATPase subunit F [Pectobacteriaceae bacterium C52]WJV68205.1 K(+)-transporting ATPase subunit F [Pectobacteriaceae bacterium CE70]
MNFGTIIGSILVVLLLIYLFYALLKAEDF